MRMVLFIGAVIGSWLIVILLAFAAVSLLAGDTAHASPAVVVPYRAGHQPGTAGNGLGVLP